MDRAALLEHRERLVALRDSLSEQIAGLDRKIGEIEPSEAVETYERQWSTTDYLDIATQFVIFCSIGVVFVESCSGNSDGASDGFEVYYWVFSTIFAAEYGFRIVISDNAFSYIFSAFGLVDLIGWLPEVLVLLIAEQHHNYPYMQCIRCLRTLRIFGSSAWIGERGQLAKESENVSTFFRHRLGRIVIVLACVMPLLTIVASFIYVLEDDEGFATLPLCLYWAIVTITTVGYGDIVPSTATGQFLAAAMMILGYSTIAMCSISVVSATDAASATPNADSPLLAQFGVRKRSATVSGPMRASSGPITAREGSHTMDKQLVPPSGL
jgi:voltage-gated potassium channel